MVLKIGKEERMLLYPYLGKDAEIPDMFLEQKTQIEENCMYKTIKMIKNVEIFNKQDKRRLKTHFLK